MFTFICCMRRRLAERKQGLVGEESGVPAEGSIVRVGFGMGQSRAGGPALGVLIAERLVIRRRRRAFEAMGSWDCGEIGDCGKFAVPDARSGSAGQRRGGSQKRGDSRAGA
jgi:hypothetical protein